MNKQIEKKRGKGKNNFKPKPGINLSPPPEDGKCACCGRHISQLKPFEGDFEGALLVMIFRREVPYNEEAEKAVDEAVKYCTGSVDDWLVDKYGKEKGDYLCFMGQLSSTLGTSWECRDCIILDEDKYFKKLNSLKKTMLL